ncbi:ankyrin repeat domain-containing protein [Litorilituus sediminis]|nr:ankyrin repeat domain-containing protein [Litorilituus sediminis]
MDLSKLWFKPYLVKNNDVACDSLLEDVQTKFLSNVSFYKAYKFSGRNNIDTNKLLDWRYLGDSQLKELQAYNKTFYLTYKQNAGCGGACETNQSLASTEAFPEKQNYSYLRELAENTHPAASYNYSIFENNDKTPYLFIVGSYFEYKGKILLYKLNADAKWESACEISVVPKGSESNSSKEYNKAKLSISALNQSIQGLTRGAGRCGSMNTEYRWRNRTTSALNQTMFRPWAMNNSAEGSVNSYGDYKRIIDSLKRWSLTGLSEHAALKAYSTQLTLTVIDLSKFYQKSFGWSESKAKWMAEFALTSAVSKGFGFYMYEPSFSKGEYELRNNILDDDSKSINSLKFDASKIDSQLTSWASPEGKESILNIAIRDPEKLKLLLDKSIDPNSVNQFGKTPLMYAAQYNQLESAKLLIEHGANTIAATTKPADTCYYTLKTTKMTALHYAVRYASSEFIRLLLDNGAEPFMTAENGHNHPTTLETALDWFYRYTLETSSEINPNIDTDELQKVEQWLKVPSDKQLLMEAKKSIIDAEKLYQQGRIKKSYELLLKALAIEPDNERTLSNMALVSLKLNRLGESLAASEKLIEKSINKKNQANGWFNQGLACEQYTLSGKRGYLNYNGQYYCNKPFIYSYLQAWLTYKTEARKNKLVSVFKDKKTNVCKVITPEGNAYQFHFLTINREDIIYFFHSNNIALTAANIFNEVNFFDVNKGQNRFPINYTPKYTASYDLGEYVVDEMMSPYGNGYPIYLGKLSCRLKEDNQN